MSMKFLRASALALACAVLGSIFTARAQPLPGGSLDPLAIPKYVTPLVVPPAMPASTSDTTVDYQIAVRQFVQQIMPPGLPATTVWSYGSVDHPGTPFEGGTFHYPAFTIEATADVPVTVKWINDLKDPVTGAFLPHLLRVDQTLHWANPPQLCADMMTMTDCKGFLPDRYTGPVPIVTHLHGSHVDPESDGFPEAWYLADASNIPFGYATRGGHFGQVAGAPDVPGQAIFRYRNDQPATTLWYHDHSLGMTRLNVYAGPAGFYLLRGGKGDEVGVVMSGAAAKLPGPAPGVGANPFGRFFEIPIAVQDRSFNKDGSLFYPESRKFFDGFLGPYAPATDVAPIWNPEFFGNTLVVNGRTWPNLDVEPRKYRFRFLNGSQSRFLILTTSSTAACDPASQPLLTFWQIGAEGGFLPQPVPLTELLVAPAERADVIVDFSAFPVGTAITLLNIGPDEPFGGGVPCVDFPVSDPSTTGQVMRFTVVAGTSIDDSTDPSLLKLPKPPALKRADNTRRVSLNEADSATVCVGPSGTHAVPCGSRNAVTFGPVAAFLGPLDMNGFPIPTLWMSPVTENPALGATEIWEIFNFTADAHPIHIHMVQFQVQNRQALATDADGISLQPATLVGFPRPPQPWETGLKDTVVVFPGEVARVKALYDIAGLFVWHCHILEHEDNEMMRPYFVGP